MPTPRLAFLLSLAVFGLSAPPAHAASLPAVEAAHGMVVTAQHLATEAGIEILKEGGNAIDAAVAVGYAQAVVNPCCGNIGGGGFMVLHLANGHDTFLNFREMAPAAAFADMYLDAQGNVIPEASRIGYKSAGIPGTVKGFDQALREYGKLPRDKVMAPAIRLARDGFVLTRFDTDIFGRLVSRLGADPATARIFERPDGSPLQPGDRLVQKDLAATLEAIAKNGPDAFYKGPVAKAVAAASAAHGGIMTEADFANYKTTETAPLKCSYRGYDIVTAPPPSAGGVTMCEIFNILSGYDMTALGFHSAQAIHLMVEAMRHAYVDRNTYIGDPAFIKNPLDRLLSADYAAAIRARIAPDKATASKDLGPGVAPHEKAETTHYSVVDKDGNVASVTYTLNGGFGAEVMAPGTGFFLNDQMDDFTVKPGVPNMYRLVEGKANAIAAGKRPLSSMTPTIVTKDGKTFLVAGSPGGSRIITITLETLMNVIDYGMDPQTAVDAPRIHHQWLPDEVFVEPLAVSPDSQKLLETMGYKLVTQRPWGASELIEVGPATPASRLALPENDAAMSGALLPGLLYGANDSRRPAGSAEGY